MKNLLSILLLSILFFSCQKKENKNPAENILETDSAEQIKPINKELAAEKNVQKGDTIFMNFKNEKELYTGEGSLDSMSSKAYVKFTNENTGELQAQIIPAGGKGNIRFNQIIFPDKSSDGPFGMELKTKLEQIGNHVLVIGHSQMADNPYIGAFKVQIEIKK